MKGNYQIVETTDKDGFPAFYAEILNSDLTRRLGVTFTYRSLDRAVLEAEGWLKANQEDAARCEP